MGKKFLLAVIFIIMFNIAGFYTTHYSMEGTVVEVNKNIIVIEDVMGHVWEIEDDSFKIGDIVKITFDTNNTDNERIDDIITFVAKK